MNPAVHANKTQQTVTVSCTKHPMPVTRDVQISLPTKLHVYAIEPLSDGYVLEIDKAGFMAMLDEMPDNYPPTPGWPSAKALFKSRLQAADSRHPIHMKYLLHADEIQSNLPLRSPANMRQVGIVGQWWGVFEMGLSSGHVMVVDTASKRPLKHIRGRAYGSKAPLPNDPGHWVSGVLYTHDGRTVQDDCYFGWVPHPAPSH